MEKKTDKRHVHCCSFFMIDAYIVNCCGFSSIIYLKTLSNLRMLPTVQSSGESGLDAIGCLKIDAFT